MPRIVKIVVSERDEVSDTASDEQMDGVSGNLQELTIPPLSLEPDAILSEFSHYFGRMLGRRSLRRSSRYIYQALAFVVRDRLMERWNETRNARETQDARKVCYLSLEYLMGRLLRNNMLNLGIEQACNEALQSIGVSLSDVTEFEHDAGLGNGGLGRLAACFLDSCATLRLPVTGYGIRYQYGMFRQKIDKGYQIEEPDPWLLDGFPWEIERIEWSQRVRFGGRSEAYRDEDGMERYHWLDTHDVLAVPFDVPVPGYRNEIVNTLRLWSAKATDEFDLDEFNAGSYADSVAAKNAAENITMVLYPNAENENGQELRLRQQYFLASASLQDTIREWTVRHGKDFSSFSDKHCFQLNDTHPAIAVAELMRLLMDDYRLSWDDAWEITRDTMAYTNHTLLPEALETWSLRMFEHLLPRILQIIFEINARFLTQVSWRWPGDVDRLRRMSLIQEGPAPMVRMAYLAIVGSRSVNGVAQLHSRLLREGLFRDFAELWPEKFNNKTNGVTPRRWLAACNPKLAELVSSAIGPEWVTDLERLQELAPHADDESFRERWRAVKLANKQRLTRVIADKTGIRIEPTMLFDVQVKRIHEYKRQALNVLHAIHLYRRIKLGDTAELPPRAILIGGKAAPGYVMAKSVIKFINDVAQVINTDPETDGLLRLIFVPDYNVSLMETICPAADLSEQISVAGKEASGTGNMKFMMNGAVTIGTLDGANVEIRDAVGSENFFLFGLTVDQMDEARRDYDPVRVIADSGALSPIFEWLDRGVFSRYEPGTFDRVVQAMRDPSDQWMTVADAESFFAVQAEVERAYLDSTRWDRMSILNSAASGQFSTDRTILDYNTDIWRLRPTVL
jgi:starch phosphorylase